MKSNYPYPCVEVTYDIVIVDYSIRLWIQKELDTFDENRDAIFPLKLPTFICSLGQKALAEYFASLPDVNAVQVITKREGYSSGLMLYVNWP